jgi:DNA invertase Pin-like site-specific DNA recombinase
MIEMINYGQDAKSIVLDKQNGKDFNREEYQKLIKRLKKGDLVYIYSIDLLGKNYKMIIDEWAKITKQIEADVFVSDMPFLDTRQQPENLVCRFISDIVLQILSFVAKKRKR